MVHLGHGISLKRDHYEHYLREGVKGIDWVEAISENFFRPGGRPWAVLERVRRDVPIALHGTAMGIGNPSGVTHDYLKQLKGLIERVEPMWVSDHLCFGGVSGVYTHELLPLPWTNGCLDRVVNEVLRVQDYLGQPLVLENISTYLQYEESTMTEGEFLAEVCRRTDCKILLDANNIAVNAHNHGYDVSAVLEPLPGDRVVEIHLAGAEPMGPLLFDAHTGPIPDGVWSVYEEILTRFGPRPTLVEWDTQTPDFETVCGESHKAKRKEEEVCGVSTKF